jgi:hypothetical protein
MFNIPYTRNNILHAINITKEISVLSILLQSLATLTIWHHWHAPEVPITALLSIYRFTFPAQFLEYDIPAASPKASILVVLSSTLVACDDVIAAPRLPAASILNLLYHPHVLSQQQASRIHH